MLVEVLREWRPRRMKNQNKSFPFSSGVLGRPLNAASFTLSHLINHLLASVRVLRNHGRSHSVSLPEGREDACTTAERRPQQTPSPHPHSPANADTLSCKLAKASLLGEGWGEGVLSRLH